MNDNNKVEPKECGARIVGPRVGGNVVAWTKKCKRKTSDPSGRCHQHRLGDKFTSFGPGGEVNR